MITHFLETTDGIAHGKFLLGRLDASEAQVKSALPMLEGQSMWRNAGGARKFRPEHTLILDLQTGEGAGWGLSDRYHCLQRLEELRAWVCPMYRPTVLWLCERATLPFAELPRYVEIDLLVKR